MTDAHCRFETELGHLPVQETRGIRKRCLGKTQQISPEFWLILGERWHAIDHRLELRCHNRRLHAIKINGKRVVAVLEIPSDVAVRKLPKNIFHRGFCCRFRPVHFRAEFLDRLPAQFEFAFADPARFADR